MPQNLPISCHSHRPGPEKYFNVAIRGRTGHQQFDYKQGRMIQINAIWAVAVGTEDRPIISHVEAGYFGGKYTNCEHSFS